MADRRDTLLIVPALRAERGEDGSFVLTRKFVDGVREYARRWPGPVAVAVEETPRNDANLDHVAVAPGSAPFDLTWLDADPESVSALVRDSGFVLASLVPQHERMASICRALEVPMAFVTEYTLETRRRIILAETGNPLRRARRLWWEQRRETRHREVVALADGVQCNGTPTWEAYHEINRNPLLYFDSRVRAEMVATPADLTERFATLRAGGPLRLAFSGRLTAMKGADHLPAVARGLDDLGVDYRLDICGAGDSEASIAREIERHGLSERVRLRGVLDFHDELMPFMIRDVDLFVCCHRQGDPSCTYLETMACGTPIVGYANEAWRGVVSRSRTGWITPMNEPRAMARCIASLDRRRGDLAVAAVAARRFALAHTFETTMQRRIDHMRGLARPVAMEAAA